MAATRSGRSPGLPPRRVFLLLPLPLPFLSRLVEPLPHLFNRLHQGIGERSIVISQIELVEPAAEAPSKATGDQRDLTRFDRLKRFSLGLVSHSRGSHLKSNTQK